MAASRAWLCRLQVANHTLTILLGLVYCIIQPVMAPVVLIYFFVNYFIAKYQAIYILRPAYESGGLVRAPQQGLL
jgi:Calcium-dependent channel, 7TM region, putative phosphate